MPPFLSHATDQEEKLHFSSNKRYKELPGVYLRRGSPMGRPNEIPEDMNPLTCKPKLRLSRMPMVDGDYDPGGAYWGSGSVPRFDAQGNFKKPTFMYWAYCLWGNRSPCHVFVRAHDRNEAKAMVREIIPHARFTR